METSIKGCEVFKLYYKSTGGFAPETPHLAAIHETRKGAEERAQRDGVSATEYYIDPTVIQS